MNAPSTPIPGPPDPAARPAIAPSTVSLQDRVRQLPRWTKYVAAVVAVVLLIALYRWLGWVSTDDAEVDAHITAVASQVSGYAVQLMINDNVEVKAGDLLVQIDPREYRAQVDQAKAALELAQAEAQSAKLQIGLTQGTTTHSTGGAEAQRESDAADYTSAQAQLERSATANLQQAKAEVAAKRATNERAQADLERYKPLVQTGDVSKFQFDAVDAAARVAKSDLEASEEQLAAAQQAVDIARANANSSKARLARSQ